MIVCLVVTLSEVERYLCWNADPLSGDDLIGDQRRTKRYDEILSNINKTLNIAAIHMKGGDNGKIK
jgi:hypothetical protein